MAAARPVELVWLDQKQPLPNNMCFIGYYGPLCPFYLTLLEKCPETVCTPNKDRKSLAKNVAILGYSSAQAVKHQQEAISTQKTTFEDIVVQLKSSAKAQLKTPQYENGHVYVAGKFRGYVFTLYDRGDKMLHIGSEEQYIPTLHTTGVSQAQIDAWVNDLCKAISHKLGLV